MTEATPHPIPFDAFDDRLAFVGTSGSGKTYATGTAVEALLALQHRAVIVDPLDVWWGLRLKADGKTPAFPVAIFGGAHGDLALTEDAGAVIGSAIAKSSQSCIVSTAALPSKAAERRFMRAFLEELDAEATGEPYHLIFDEADLWAPQRATGETATLLGLMEEIVRRGRVKGFIPWLISQRPAVIAKDVLSQMDGMIAMKLTGAHDRKAIAEWIGASAGQAEVKAVTDNLATFQRGSGMLWIPARDVLQGVTFPQKVTFDSSRTPKRGETKRSVTMTPIDIASLKAAIAAKPAEKAAASPKLAGRVLDPAELAASEDRGYRRGLIDGERLAFQKIAEKFTAQIKEWDRFMKAARDEIVSIFTVPPGQQGPLVGKINASPAASTKMPVLSPAIPSPARDTAKVSTGLTPAKQRVLDAIAWWHVVGIDPVDRARACVVAGFSPKASTFGVYIAELARSGHVAIEPGKVSLTATGMEAAYYPTASTDADLRAAARGQLGAQEARVFDVVYECWPKAIRRDAIAKALGLSPNASTAGVYISKVASFGIIENAGRGEVRAADWLFPATR